MCLSVAIVWMVPMVSIVLAVFMCIGVLVCLFNGLFDGCFSADGIFVYARVPVLYKKKSSASVAVGRGDAAAQVECPALFTIQITRMLFFHIIHIKIPNDIPFFLVGQLINWKKKSKP